jgi:HEAT repeat protein
MNLTPGTKNIFIAFAVLAAAALIFYAAAPGFKTNALRAKIEKDPSRAGDAVLELGAEGISILKERLQNPEQARREQGLALLENIIAEPPLYAEKPLKFGNADMPFRDFLLTNKGAELVKALRECAVFPSKGVRERALGLMYSLSIRREGGRIFPEPERMRLFLIAGGQTTAASRGALELENAFLSGDQTNVYEAVLSAALTGDSSFISELRNASLTRNVPIRTAGVSAIGLCGGPADEEFVLGLAKDGDEEVLTEALIALGRIGGSASAGFIAEKSSSFGAKPFRAAAESFILITGAPVMPPASSSAEERAATEAAIGKFWNENNCSFEPRKGRLAALEHKSPKVALGAISAMGKSGDKSYSTHLIPLLRNADPAMRAAAAAALGELRSTGAVEDLINLLSDSDNSAALAADSALAAITGKDFYFSTLASAGPGWEEIKGDSIRAWRRWYDAFRDKPYEDWLLETIESPASSVEALKTLSQSGTEKTVRRLLEFLSPSSTNERVERRFLQYLVNMTAHPDSSRHAAAARIISEAAARDDFALGEIRLENGSAAITEPSKDIKYGNRAAIWNFWFDYELSPPENRASAFKRSLNSVLVSRENAELIAALGLSGELDSAYASAIRADERIRVKAAGTLGALAGVKESAGILGLLCAEESPDVRSALAFAAVRSGKSISAEKLAELAVTGSEEVLAPASNALKTADETAVFKRLYEFASDPDYHVRDRLAVVLGKIGSFEGIPILADFLLDPELPVRSSAIESLDIITSERFGYSPGMDKESAERIAVHFKSLYRRHKEEPKNQ